jgi:co-chaperonin GroES (HSP10)
MVILTQEERENHIRWIRENSDYAYPVSPGRRFVIIHLAEKETKTKSNLILPASIQEDVKLQYRNFPAQLGLVVSVSDQEIIDEAGLQELNSDNRPGEFLDTDLTVSPGDYIRFDPMGAFTFTNRHTGIQYLLIYEINLLTKIAATRIEKNDPKLMSFPEDPTVPDDPTVEELQW